ncbi:MAG: hypothetical protein LQ341_006578 [Variospora aurantia]|nr:MAG: hypothetical protein LQ341_006578 [Variospora aurantia]
MLYSSEVSPRMFNVRKQKLCKDEATFTKGKPQEEVRYWPCEHQDRHIAAEHQRFKLYPIGHITEYCKHVPYRSEKKPVFTKTGREGFHDHTQLQRACYGRLRYAPRTEAEKPSRNSVISRDVVLDGRKWPTQKPQGIRQRKRIQHGNRHRTQ